MICNKCGEDKPPETGFERREAKRGGFRQPCRMCRRPAYRKKFQLYRERHPLTEDEKAAESRRTRKYYDTDEARDKAVAWSYIKRGIPQNIAQAHVAVAQVKRAIKKIYGENRK